MEFERRSVTMQPAKKRKLAYKVCPHCGKELNIRTYKDHRRLYFNEGTNSWFQESESDTPGLSSDEISPPSSPTQQPVSMELSPKPVSVITEEPMEDVILPPDEHEHNYGVHHEEEFWVEDECELTADIHPQRESTPPLPCDDAEDMDKKESEAVVWWVVLFVSLFQTLHLISDRAVIWLLKFVHALLRYCGQYSPKVKLVADCMPCTLYQRDKYLSKKLYSTEFQRYIACPICHTLYSFKECLVKTGRNLMPKACSYTRFSKKCTGVMLQEVVTLSGSKTFYPHRIYCYNGIINTLKRMLLRQGFFELCESNRNTTPKGNLLSDVCDGNMWRDFLVVDGVNFLSAACTYAFMLNIDWFQPYELSTYSVGVIYLVLLNLPRSIRYKRENIVLIGVIPGPTEPPLLMNTYLNSLVTELLKLWEGISIQVCTSSKSLQTMTVRAALIAVACDIPAGRKVCGFLSHSARFGCTRCFCDFIRDRNETFSKFKREEWEVRTTDRHRSDLMKLKKCKSKTEQEKMELEIGCRYTILLKLPYFNPVRMLLLDPMHNLFLGSAKYVVKSIWISKGLLTTSALDTIYERMKAVRLHMDTGRIPSRLDSGTTFTAEQWMNWTIYYSVLCLRGMLPRDDMECWRHFVLACRRLCKKALTQDDVTLADALLMRFCKRIGCLYGKLSITPNMHIHAHLTSCIRDYGPCHTFWLFSFERCNGILGKQPTNNRSIEVQLMNRFMKDSMHLDLLNQVKSSSTPLAEFFGDPIKQHAERFPSLASTSEIPCGFSEPPKYTLCVLQPERLTVLKSMYSMLYPDVGGSLETTVMPTIAKKFVYVWMDGEKLSSIDDKSPNPYIIAKPVFPFPTHGNLARRPAEVQYFIHHSFECNSTCITQTFAAVRWPQVHPHVDSVGKPVEVWCYDLFEPDTINCFVPLNNIVSRVIVAVDKFEGETCLFVIPVV